MEIRTKLGLSGLVATLGLLALPQVRGPIVSNLMTTAHQKLVTSYDTHPNLQLGTNRQCLTEKELEEIFHKYKNEVARCGFSHLRLKWTGEINRENIENYSQTWWWSSFDSVEDRLDNQTATIEKISKTVAEEIYYTIQNQNQNATPKEIVSFMYEKLGKENVGEKAPGFTAEYIRRFECYSKEQIMMASPDKFQHFLEGAIMQINFGSEKTKYAIYGRELMDLLGPGRFSEDDIQAGLAGISWAKTLQ